MTDPYLREASYVWDRTRSSAAVASAVRRLGLPDRVGEAACEAIIIARQEEIARGRSLRAFAAAGLLIKAVDAHQPKPIDWIAEAFDINEDQMRQSVKVLQQTGEMVFALITPTDVLIELCERSEAPPEVSERAFEYLDTLEAAGKTNNRPSSSVAAACLVHAFITVNPADAPSQKSITALTTTTPTTMHKRREELKAELTEP
ncbi:hypothetical protein ACFQL9_13345 [Halobaculum lipolyticum]|uniref:Transcription factor TFIIB cyclin-like domain-containing protein n=1 Tax=Halobaculum lipolyticum TaxID=3032001 RepID=A0ABD5WCC7_9EURY